MANVDRRALESVLQAERVNDEHRVVEKEFRGQPPVLHNVLVLFRPAIRCATRRRGCHEYTGRPFVLPRHDLGFHRRDDEEIVRVHLEP